MDLAWLYPRSFEEFLTMVVLALILDLVYPYHKGLWYKVHPVHTAYFMALKLRRFMPKTVLAGIAIWFSVVSTHIFAYALVLYLSNAVDRALWIVISSYILKVSLSLRLLLDHVRSTGTCLRRSDLDCARMAIAGAVRRSVSELDEGHVASAAIETLFENLVDGFTSPLLYFMLLGPLGALLQRLANTLDAALGYRSGELLKVGWFSAKVDTILNYLPSRMTMLIMVALCPSVGGSTRSGLMMYVRDGKTIESLNARAMIATAAGCLGVRLEKVGYYCIGREFRLPGGTEVFKALKLALYVSILYLLILHALWMLLFSR